MEFRSFSMQSRSAGDSCRFANAATYSTSFWVIFIVRDRIECVQRLSRSIAESSLCTEERSHPAAFASPGRERELAEFRFRMPKPAFGPRRQIRMQGTKRVQPPLLQGLL